MISFHEKYCMPMDIKKSIGPVKATTVPWIKVLIHCHQSDPAHREKPRPAQFVL